MVYIMFLLFLFFAICGVPIAFSLGVASLVYMVINDVTLVLIAQKMFTGMDAFLLTAIPLFILAGNLMNASGLTSELIDFSKIFVGRIRGGLAYVNVIISMIFAGMTGAGVSDTAAVGTIMIPGMTKDGYKKDFSTAVTVISSTIGPIIPPSIPFIVYGSITGISIGSLFLAGIIPGILLALSMMGVIFYRSTQEELPRIEKVFTLSEKVLISKDALLALMMPVIILGGIVGGIATPTESAGIAAFYAFVVGVFIRKKITFKRFVDELVQTAITTGAVMILMGTAAIFSFILTTEFFPQQVAEAVLSLTDNKIIILLLINIVLLVFGMFLDVVPALLIMTPVFLPLVKMVGVDPLHYGVFCVLNLVIGLATPPVGMCLFVGANIAKLSIEKISKSLLPFLVAAFSVLLIVTYWEAAILWIPRMFGLHE
ncbi:TRAP transporter large permease [Desulforhopalus vacuolatus]|uniref:TRAP transporter large permease n=1 Tax=Desulforhopalus vacuolatus TaxID=40414 RepID=UPI0019628EF4|nr:TRAP transporter large permease [Desulforhopalus vacuolatus]MBM9518200.1 TRAP transporter large permease [Desulforhopalus vacuolatus]